MLSKETTDQINKEADDFGFQVPYNGTNKFYNDDRLKGYIAGATAWAVWKEKAEGYEKALKEISEGIEGLESFKIAKTALEQFK